jgi:hypothetical protein
MKITNKTIRIIAVFSILTFGLYLSAVFRNYIYHGELMWNFLRFPNIKRYLIIIPVVIIMVYFIEKQIEK